MPPGAELQVWVGSTQWLILHPPALWHLWSIMSQEAFRGFYPHSSAMQAATSLFQRPYFLVWPKCSPDVFTVGLTSVDLGQECVCVCVRVFPPHLSCPWVLQHHGCVRITYQVERMRAWKSSYNTRSVSPVSLEPSFIFRGIFGMEGDWGLAAGTCLF